MSHEIRTPMNGIIGMTEALYREELTANQKEYISIVRSSADLLLNIIDDILDYSKIEAGKMLIEEIPYNLREEVNLSVELFRVIAEEKGLELMLDIKEEVPNKIIGDPFRLRQVLSNLISNAVKFTHQGIIKISVELEDSYSGNITLLFNVSDTGVGISKEKIPTIFNTFTQADINTSRKYGGSGLGTTICKQLVTLMNGEIWIDSPSGLSSNKNMPGSNFQFTIEVFSYEILPKDLDFSNIKSLDKVKALIITHNNSTKKRLYAFLKQQRIQTDTLHYGENVISEIENKIDKNDYHLLIIVDEPGLNGIWLGQKLQEHDYTDKYRIIILSSNHKSENYIQSRLAGVDYYLVQPFEHRKLKETLKEIFENTADNPDEIGLELRKDIQILIAEDNIINQKVAQNIFKNLGYDIAIASNGKEALELMKKNEYEIIFMDLEMPEMDGFEAASELRSLGFQVPIVAMTASATEQTKKDSFKAGMNEYTTKPVKSETVIAILEKWFA